MRIFELRPVEGGEGHADWAFSDHCGPCRVIAEDEQAARNFAANEFMRSAPHGFSASSPWQNPKLVKAVFVISGAHPMPPLGTVMMPAKGYPGFSLGRGARRRMSKSDDDAQ